MSEELVQTHAVGKFGTRRRWAKVASIFALCVGLSVSAASPALAWGSSNYPDINPPNCSGGYAGSSSHNSSYLSTYASSSRYGSSCSSGYPTLGAYIRYSDGTNLLWCQTSSDFCSRTQSASTIAIGGLHVWGNKAFTT